MRLISAPLIVLLLMLNSNNVRDVCALAKTHPRFSTCNLASGGRGWNFWCGAATFKLVKEANFAGKKCACGRDEPNAMAAAELIRTEDERVSEKFLISTKPIGSGSFAEVYHAIELLISSEKNNEFEMGRCVGMKVARIAPKEGAGAAIKIPEKKSFGQHAADLLAAEAALIPPFRVRPPEHLIKLYEAYYYKDRKRRQRSMAIKMELGEDTLKHYWVQQMEKYKFGLEDEEEIFLPILMQILKGIGELHELDYVHTDVKAENAMVFNAPDHLDNLSVAELHLKFIDLGGVVKLENGDKGGGGVDNENREQQVHYPSTTQFFEAPELYKLRKFDTNIFKVSKKSDIWSFGMLILDLIAMTPAFTQYWALRMNMLHNPRLDWRQTLLYMAKFAINDGNNSSESGSILNHQMNAVDMSEFLHRNFPKMMQIVEACLQQDPTRRPSAETLLNTYFEVSPSASTAEREEDDHHSRMATIKQHQGRGKNIVNNPAQILKEDEEGEIVELGGMDEQNNGADEGENSDVIRENNNYVLDQPQPPPLPSRSSNRKSKPHKLTKAALRLLSVPEENENGQQQQQSPKNNIAADLYPVPKGNTLTGLLPYMWKIFKKARQGMKENKRISIERTNNSASRIVPSSSPAGHPEERIVVVPPPAPAAVEQQQRGIQQRQMEMERRRRNQRRRISSGVPHQQQEMESMRPDQRFYKNICQYIEALVKASLAPLQLPNIPTPFYGHFPKRDDGEYGGEIDKIVSTIWWHTDHQHIWPHQILAEMRWRSAEKYGLWQKVTLKMLNSLNAQFGIGGHEQLDQFYVHLFRLLCDALNVQRIVGSEAMKIFSPLRFWLWGILTNLSQSRRRIELIN